MRRILPFLLLLVCIPAHASVGYVQSDGSFSLSTAGTTQTDTLTHTTTAGDDILVGLSFKTATRSVKSITATGAVFVPYVGEFPNSTNDMATIWVCHKCAAISSIVVTITGTSVFETEVEEYSGVVSYGQAVAQCGNSAQSACANSANPQGTITLQDANNIIVMVSASIGSDGIPTAVTGNLRDAGRTANATTGVAGAFCDNTASSGAVTCEVAITSSAWSSVTLELRSGKAPMTDHVESYGTGNSNDQNNTQNTFKVPISSDLTLPGNTAICWITWPGSVSTPTVADDKSDTWTKDKEVDDASNQDVAIFRTATTTGAHLVTFTFGSAFAAGSSIAAHCASFNMPSATPDATCGAATVATGPLLNCGSMTTSAADVIFVVASYDGGLGYLNTGMGPCREGAGYTILIAANNVGYCSEFTVTSGSGTPNPAIYFGEFATGASGISTNQYNIIGAAYKNPGSGGTNPSGLYIARQWETVQQNTTMYVNCPSAGNLATAAVSQLNGVITVSDSNQVAWTNNVPSSTAGSLLHSDNSSLDASSMCKQVNTDSGNDEAIFRDISGAATSSPVVAPTACPSPSSLTNSGNNIGCYNGAVTGSPMNDAPNITPANSGDMIIAVQQIGTGPSTACASPSGCIYDLGTYTTQSDGNGWGFGEGHAHYYTTATSALDFEWTIASSETGGAAAFEIHAAPAVGGGTIIPGLPLFGAGVGERTEPSVVQ